MLAKFWNKQEHLNFVQNTNVVKSKINYSQSLKILNKLMVVMTPFLRFLQLQMTTPSHSFSATEASCDFFSSPAKEVDPVISKKPRTPYYSTKNWIAPGELDGTGPERLILLLMLIFNDNVNVNVTKFRLWKLTSWKTFSFPEI